MAVSMQRRTLYLLAIVVMCCVFCGPSVATATWVAQKSHTKASLTDVDFVNASVGYAVGATWDNEVILKTVDGGKTWSVKRFTVPPGRIPGNPWLTAVDFADARIGYVVGRECVMRTTDGGATWVDVSPSGTNLQLGEMPAWSEFSAAHFSDANNGWVVDQQSGYVFVTTDGGVGWSMISYASPKNLNINSMDVAGSSAWVIDLDYVYRTTNGGQTWSRKRLGSSVTLYSTSFFDTQRGYLGACERRIYTTTNGGASWKRRLLPKTKGSYASTNVQAVTSKRAFAFGREIFITRDGGAHWSRQWKPAKYDGSRDLVAMSYVNGKAAWVVGQQGIILRLK